MTVTRGHAHSASFLRAVVGAVDELKNRGIGFVSKLIKNND